VEALAAIERWPVVGLLRTSFYVYPVVSALHIAAIGALLTCVAFLDLRVLGLLRSIGGEPFDTVMRRAAIAAFAAAAFSGAVLFSVRATDYGASTLFRAKLMLILLAGVNLAMFFRLARRRPAGAPAGAGERIVASASLCLWVGVLLCGRFLGFV
jgi:hypothetical protein